MKDFRTLTLGPFETNCYILKTEGEEVLVIDPGTRSNLLCSSLEEIKGKVVYILCTHGHLDHIEGAGLVKDKFGGKVVLHSEDLPLWENVAAQARLFGLPEPDPLPQPDFLLRKDSSLSLESGSIEVFHTPGHSPGSACFVFQEQGLVFSGDVVFCGGVGRVDLWGGDAKALRHSIEERIFALPDHYVLYPGHGPSLRISEAKRTCPLQWL